MSTQNPAGTAGGDQVEIDLSERKKEYEMKEMDPYDASSPEVQDMGRPSTVPVNHKEIDVNAFG